MDKHPTPDKMITIEEINGMLGVSTSTVWRWIAYRAFPKPFALGTQVRRWRASEVHAWVNAQPVVSSAREL